MVTYASSWLDPKEVRRGCPWVAGFNVRISDWKVNGEDRVPFVVPGPTSRPWSSWGSFLPPALQSGDLEKDSSGASHALTFLARHPRGASPLKGFGVMTACLVPCTLPPGLCFSDSSSCGENVSCRKPSTSSLAWMPSTLWIWQSRKLSGLKLAYKFCTKKENRHQEHTGETQHQMFCSGKFLKN